jgi:hypothetical protein
MRLSVSLLLALLLPVPAAASDPAWDAYEARILAFSADMTAMQAEADAATSREQGSAVYGEMLARSIDHVAWAVSTPWEGCYAAFADSYWRWSQLWAIGMAALYQQASAIEGDPVALDALAVLGTIYDLRASTTQKLLDGVTCDG